MGDICAGSSFYTFTVDSVLSSFFILLDSKYSNNLLFLTVNSQGSMWMDWKCEKLFKLFKLFFFRLN